jgi:hypothetical protein
MNEAQDSAIRCFAVCHIGHAVTTALSRRTTLEWSWDAIWNRYPLTQSGLQQ